MKAISRLAAAAALMTLLSVPAAEARTRVYVNLAPPPIVVEHQSVAPGPDFVWQAGFHRWDGRAYAWVPGQWVRRPHRNARWEAGRWNHDHHGYYWQDGRWR